MMNVTKIIATSINSNIVTDFDLKSKYLTSKREKPKKNLKLRLFRIYRF